MTTYHFDYTDQPYLLRLIVFSFLLFIALLVTMIFTIDVLGTVGGMIIAFAVPGLIFWRQIKKVKKKGTALIAEDRVEFSIQYPITIFFADISAVKVGAYNGSSLTLKQKKNKKFFLRANVNYTSPESFAICCAAIYASLDAYAVTQHLTVTKKKTMFEQHLIIQHM